MSLKRPPPTLAYYLFQSVPVVNKLIIKGESTIRDQQRMPKYGTSAISPHTPTPLFPDLGQLPDPLLSVLIYFLGCRIRVSAPSSFSEPIYFCSIVIDSSISLIIVNEFTLGVLEHFLAALKSPSAAYLLSAACRP